MQLKYFIEWNMVGGGAHSGANISPQRAPYLCNCVHTPSRAIPDGIVSAMTMVLIV